MTNFRFICTAFFFLLIASFAACDSHIVETEQQVGPEWGGECSQTCNTVTHEECGEYFYCAELDQSRGICDVVAKACVQGCIVRTNDFGELIFDSCERSSNQYLQCNVTTGECEDRTPASGGSVGGGTVGGSTGGSTPSVGSGVPIEICVWTSSSDPYAQINWSQGPSSGNHARLFNLGRDLTINSDGRACVTAQTVCKGFWFDTTSSEDTIELADGTWEFSGNPMWGDGATRPTAASIDGVIYNDPSDFKWQQNAGWFVGNVANVSGCN